MDLSTDKILDHVKCSVEEVFETMLNTVAVLVDRGECEHTNDAIQAEEDAFTAPVAIEALVSFHGSINGSVILRASTRGAADITRRMLMMDEDEIAEIEEIRDAMGECANMVTGALKTRALDPAGCFELTIPVIDTKVNVEYENPAGRLAFKLADGGVAVEVWLEEVYE